jgi:hypothetical protein
MNTKKQRIAIAEYCGWKWHGRIKGGIKVWDNGVDYVFYDSDLPDYLNDLNAMQEAERFLIEKDRSFKARYRTKLVFSSDYSVDNRQPYWMATAAQRAEAFLRTIDKWI